MSAEIPDRAKLYMDVIQDRRDHPFIRERFHQVTWLASPDPAHGGVDFFALEFRVGMFAALVWMTVAGKWATGTWLPLVHRGADITCPPSQVTVDYLSHAPAHASLNAALAHLSQTVPIKTRERTGLIATLRKWFGG